MWQLTYKLYPTDTEASVYVLNKHQSGETFDWMFIVTWLFGPEFADLMRVTFKTVKRVEMKAVKGRLQATIT